MCIIYVAPGIVVAKNLEIFVTGMLSGSGSGSFISRIL